MHSPKDTILTALSTQTNLIMEWEAWIRWIGGQMIQSSLFFFSGKVKGFNKHTSENFMVPSSSRISVVHTNILPHDLTYTSINRNTSLSFADWRFLVSNAVKIWNFWEDFDVYSNGQNQIVVIVLHAIIAWKSLHNIYNVLKEKIITGSKH